MAQKKLLLVVMALIILFLAASSRAEKKVELLAEKVAGADREGFKGIMEKSREIIMSAIAEKYRELLMLRGQQQDGLTEHNSLRGLDEQGRNYRDSSILKVFVSSSMGTELLKTYAKEARRYGGVLVFKGLPDNS